MWLVLRYSSDDGLSDVVPYTNHREAQLRFKEIVDTLVDAWNGRLFTESYFSVPTGFHDQREWVNQHGQHVTREYIEHAKKRGLYWIYTPDGSDYVQLVKAENGVTYSI